MTLRAALADAARRLSAVSATARLDAELLAAYAFNTTRSTLILKHLEGPVPAGFVELIARRITHEPVAYITGETDFWTLTLRVSPDVLIPRADSETLIEAAIAHFGDTAPRSVLDLGTGSGALLLAALSHWPQAAGIGVDASEAALDIAQRNADRLRLASRTMFRQGNWAQDVKAQFDLILCNPPYVETGATLSPEVLGEPHDALFAGEDGLDDYRRLAPQLLPLLAPGGCAAIEIGSTQAGSASALFSAQGFQITIRQDLGGHNRCLTLTLT